MKRRAFAALVLIFFACGTQERIEEPLDPETEQAAPPVSVADAVENLPPLEPIPRSPQPEAHPEEAPPEPTPPPKQALRIAVISDLNESFGSRNYGSAVHAATRALTEELRPDLVLIAGDMVAGQKSGLDYAAMWSAFHQAVTTPLIDAGIAVAPAPGNHDASGYAAFANERSIYSAQWKEASRMLGGKDVTLIDTSAYPLRYSFSAGGVFFLALDATTVGTVSKTQREWVKDQLTNATAAGFKVKIAFGHLPLWAIAIGRESEALFDAALQDVFEQGGLSLYVSGHHHAYYPGKRRALRLAHAGCLGAGARKLVGTTTLSQRSLMLIEIEDHAVVTLEAFAASDFGSAILRPDLPESITVGGVRIDRDDMN